MTVGETIKKLENSKSYVLDRILISDEFIDMVKNMLPSDYERIAEKEEQYLENLNFLKSHNQAE